MTEWILMRARDLKWSRVCLFYHKFLAVERKCFNYSQSFPVTVQRLAFMQYQAKLVTRASLMLFSHQARTANPLLALDPSHYSKLVPIVHKMSIPVFTLCLTLIQTFPTASHQTWTSNMNRLVTQSPRKTA